MAVEEDFLICPLDGLLLSKSSSSFVCRNGHNFDVAKQGYINLLPVQHKRSKRPGDSKTMVKARQRFLDTGAYETVATQLAMQLQALAEHKEVLRCIDAGCGEGYYLAYFQQYFAQQRSAVIFQACGVDISKDAILAASKRSKQITWVVGSNKQLPVAQRSMDVVLCMFGFPHFENFAKVLKPGGCLLMVDPNEDHLYELRALLYDEVAKKARPKHAGAAACGFSMFDEKDCRYEFHLSDPQSIADLAMMTPHYFRAKQEAKEKLERLTTLDISVDVCIKTFQLRV